jgi:hypothetical protein
MTGRRPARPGVTSQPIHPNVVVLDRLFTALSRHDPVTAASCYHPKARFRDIAFGLEGADDIYDMWRLVCSSDAQLELTVEEREADDRAGRARIVDTYRFGASRRERRKGVKVTNRIVSRFQFRDGLIWRQEDECDARAWAAQAMGGGVKSALAGRFRFVRSLGACRGHRKDRCLPGYRGRSDPSDMAGRQRRSAREGRKPAFRRAGRSSSSAGMRMRGQRCSRSWKIRGMSDTGISPWFSAAAFA